MNPSYLTSDPFNSEPLLSVIDTQLGQPLPELVQLVYLSIQNIHELLQLALHAALLLSAVVDVHLKASYPSLQLVVLHLCSLWTKMGGGYVTEIGGPTHINFISKEGCQSSSGVFIGYQHISPVKIKLNKLKWFLMCSLKTLKTI